MTARLTVPAARAIFPVWLAEFRGTGYPERKRCGGNRRRRIQALEVKTFRCLGKKRITAEVGQPGAGPRPPGF
jgi:hypothetical protein